MLTLIKKISLFGMLVLSNLGFSSSSEAFNIGAHGLRSDENVIENEANSFSAEEKRAIRLTHKQCEEFFRSSIEKPSIDPATHRRALRVRLHPCSLYEYNGVDPESKVEVAHIKSMRKAEDELNITLLTVAKEGDINSIRSCLEMRANPLVVDREYRSILHHLVEGRHFDTLKAVLAMNIIPVDFRQCGKYQKTALMRAAELGRGVCVDLLLKAGADIHKTVSDRGVIKHAYGIALDALHKARFEEGEESVFCCGCTYAVFLLKTHQEEERAVMTAGASISVDGK